MVWNAYQLQLIEVNSMMARNRLLEHLNIDHFSEDPVYSRSTDGAGLLDPPLATPRREDSDWYSSRAMTAPQRREQDHFFCISREGLEDRERNPREDTRRLGAAECGLCLDEFLDCGSKIPRNLLCGHTFCTGI